MHGTSLRIRRGFGIFTESSAGTRGVNRSRMKTGRFEIHEVRGGMFAVDGGAMFGIIPRALWSKTNPPDEQGRITMMMRSILVSGAGRMILVDTGAGTKLTEKQRKIYCITEPDALIRSLDVRGVRPGDITDVILTHLHFDHCGGSTAALRDGRLEPAFPNARFYVQRAQYEWAQNPPDRDEASFFAENYEPLHEQGRLQLLDGPCEIIPGVEVLVVTGHTPGQQLPKVSGDDRTVLFGADLVPLVSHLPLVYGMAYDHWPLTTIEEKRRILSQAADRCWVVVFEHDPLIAAGTIKQSEKGFALDERIDL